MTPLLGVLADAHGLSWSVAALLPLPLLALLVSLRPPRPTASAHGAPSREEAPPERAAPPR